jgi:hypothetical protein
MNAKLSRKIRKSINSALTAKEKEMVDEIFNCLDSLPFSKRVRLAVRLIRGKL